MLVYTIRWLNHNEQHWKGKGKHGKGKKGVCVVSQLFLPETVVKSCVSLTSKYIFVLNFHHENNCSSYQQQIILYYTSGILLLIIVNAVYVLTNPDICYICNTAYVKKTQYLLYLSSYILHSKKKGWLVNTIMPAYKTLNEAEEHCHLSSSDYLNSMILEKEDNRPTRGPCRSIGTMIDSKMLAILVFSNNLHFMIPQPLGDKLQPQPSPDFRCYLKSVRADMIYICR